MEWRFLFRNETSTSDLQAAWRDFSAIQSARKRLCCNSLKIFWKFVQETAWQDFPADLIIRALRLPSGYVTRGATIFARCSIIPISPGGLEGGYGIENRGGYAARQTEHFLLR